MPITPEVLAERANAAKKVAAAANRKAAKVAGDESVNRSTRARAALKIKADGLDQVIAALAGKD